MTQEELLKAENAFIRLYNQGLSVEDIAGKLGVEVRLIDEWRTKLGIANWNANNQDDPLNASVQGVDYEGNYIYSHSITLTMSGLEKLKFDLWNVSTKQSEKHFLKSIIEQAKEYLEFVDQHVVSFNYKFDEINSKHPSIKSKFSLNTERPEIHTKALEMLDFYSQYVLRFEHKRLNAVLLNNESIDYFTYSTDVLPYAIKTILIENFQGIESFRLEKLPVDNQWIFISGDNGYGKTTFLRAIAVGLFGEKEDDKRLVEDAYFKLGIEYKNNFANVINNLGALGFQPLEYLACYGPSRLQIQAKMSQNEVAEKSTTTYGLFNPDGILLNIESKLIEWHLEKNERLEQVTVLLRTVIPALANIVVKKNEQEDYEVLYVEHADEDETSTFEPVPFDKLAAGFRSIIGLVGDLLIRFIRKQPNVKQLAGLAGIVIIDELENHLHPKWQYQLPSLLSKVFPNIQFIAATHSVIPILGSPKNSVFLKLNRSKEQGITVERIDIDVANLLPNSILTSPIFDMDTIRPIANESLSQLRTEDTYAEVVANDEVDKRLRELDKDPSQYPALLQE